MSRSHEHGLAALARIVEEFDIQDVSHELRWYASDHMLETMPYLQEIGTSDVSIHLAELALHRPELLREEAERLRDREVLVRRSAARLGLSLDEARSKLQQLFAPISES
ncbi:hypothetical protein ACIB24_20535 [Spongisporangium articulatum]|uniref:Uncharacterized protein n=1 Tax=Spongisporangium articulatum TaxID=3362603 RepID=A0ABW8ASV1_9ACTN